jgi:hypothetical protein
MRSFQVFLLSLFFLFFLFSLLGFVPFSVGAQESSAPVAHIFFTGDAGFTLTTSGRSFVYSGAGIDNKGFPLSRADILQTGAGGTVEIQLVPSGTVIKLAENTSFIYNEHNNYQLLYGRIRIITGTNQAPIVISTDSAKIDVSGGDVDVDYIFEPIPEQGSSGLLLRLFCFAGTAQISPFFPVSPLAQPSDAPANIPAMIVMEGESLLYQASDSMLLAEHKPLDEAIIKYWDRHYFEGNPLVRMPSTWLPSLAPVEPEPRIEWVSSIEYIPVFPDYTPYIKANRRKNTALIVGIVGIAAGITLHLLPFNELDQRLDFGDDFSFMPSLSYRDWGMYASLGIGGISLITSLFINPRR